MLSSVVLALAVPLVAADVPVVVELFTSQGCSSCPPADEVLARLAAEHPEVIVLSEHVDYWNQLGWKDPFSNRQFSERQQGYSALFKQQGVYTPQMIINGRVELIGSDERLARREVQRAASSAGFTPANVKLAMQKLDRKKESIQFALTVDSLPQLNENDTAQVWLAITESGLENPVKAGENSGRTLRHTGVVRTLVQASDMKTAAYSALAKVAIQPGWKLNQLRAVLFVQEKLSRRILGAASIPIAIP